MSALRLLPNSLPAICTNGRCCRNRLIMMLSCSTVADPRASRNLLYWLKAISCAHISSPAPPLLLLRRRAATHTEKRVRKPRHAAAGPPCCSTSPFPVPSSPVQVHGRPPPAPGPRSARRRRLAPARRRLTASAGGDDGAARNAAGCRLQSSLRGGEAGTPAQLGPPVRPNVLGSQHVVPCTGSWT